MGLRPTNSDENHVGRASTPAAGLQTRLFPNRLRWVFDCARVLQDPLLAQRNRRAWTPAAGLEARPTINASVRLRQNYAALGSQPAAPALLPALGGHAKTSGPRACLSLYRALLAGLLLLSSACMVGPNYKRPAAPQTPAFKEPPPEGWKEAQPADGTIKGKWWEIYNDSQLNALEEQVSISNQNVLAAEANFRAARYAIAIARAGLYPTVTVAPSIATSRASSGFVSGSTVTAAPSIVTTYSLPASASWTADIWGSVRRSVRASEATAQSDFALLENARLSYQSELAEDYFELHGTDGDIDLLSTTVKSYEDYLKLTKDRYNSGVASGGDVALAQTQLDTTRAQLIDLGVARAQYEHAIAILAGKTPAAVTLPAAVLKTPPPPVPVALPSTLLERRPDIAAAERTVAAANEQIGIAIAAYYPTLTLSASGGFEATNIAKWFSLPSRFWSLGAGMSEVVFEGGKRRAQVKMTEAQYDSTVANYRQTVLTAFQQVEDNLAALRILGEESVAAETATKAAKDSLDIATYQYKAGTVNYLTVITAQATYLANEQTVVNLLARRLTSSVLLVQALGGGWDSKEIPAPGELRQGL
jgi:NodT family efflux transporter outer membrane factor (OMF) lipoprotein